MFLLYKTNKENIIGMFPDESLAKELCDEWNKKDNCSDYKYIKLNK